MQHTVFRVRPDRFLEKYPDLDLKELAGRDDAPLWIDINQRDPGELAEFLRSLDLHPLAIEASLEPIPNSRIGAYGKSLFIGLPLLTDWEDRQRDFITILCLPGKLITIHERPIPSLAGIARDFSSTMQFHTADTSAVLYQILDHIIDREIVLALEIREKIDSLEEGLEVETDSVLPQETHFLKRQVVLLEAILEDQHHCVTFLQTVESEAFSIDGLQDYIRDAIAHLEYAVRSLGRQADRLMAARQYFLFALQDKANRRLQILTIVSAIFLPLMLLTGIYGMNFRYMPELFWRYGYFGVLLIMFLIAVGQLCFFYKKGWFK